MPAVIVLMLEEVGLLLLVALLDGAARTETLPVLAPMVKLEDPERKEEDVADAVAPVLVTAEELAVLTLVDADVAVAELLLVALPTPTHS